MSYQLVEIVTASDPALRNRSLEELCRTASVPTLLGQCQALDAFRRDCPNLYERVRALLFLYAAHRFDLMLRPDMPPTGLLPFKGYENLLHRRFEEAIDIFLKAQETGGPNHAIS